MKKPQDTRHSAEKTNLAPGLYLVSTPIGSARDITLRALDVLTSADILAAEDTRNARKLLELHGIELRGRPLWPYHDHNGAQVRPRILDALKDGRAVAYVSDAGTPLVADPGYQLGAAAAEANISVWSAPGPSAALAALVVSGMPSDRFLFAGFPPGRGEKQRVWLETQAATGATVILFESAKRVHEMLGTLGDIWGEDGPIALCRELTKRHEEIIRGTITSVAERISQRTLKGEIVLVLGPRVARAPEPKDVEAALRQALATQKVKAASGEVAQQFGLPRREVYQMALSLVAKDDE